MTNLHTPVSFSEMLDFRQFDWRRLCDLWPELNALNECPQDPVHHAEGDVGTHTAMVLEALVENSRFQDLPEDRQALMFWAAVFHDVGKPAKTVHEEDGRISSRGHSRTGGNIARRLLWQVGVPYQWREDVCQIINAHQVPFWLADKPDAKRDRTAIELSWLLRPEELNLHAMADARGRICADPERIAEQVLLADIVFEELDCLDQPFRFGNNESRVAYFSKEDRSPYYEAHEDFSCVVTMLSGLPGSGKDTWIEWSGKGRPVISLDDIRQELKLPHGKNQGLVAQTAKERAREYLRKGEPFIWNATNLTRNTRAPLLQLFRDYGAFTHIAYVETTPEKVLKQNAGRPDAVPEDVILDKVGKLEPPTLIEAHSVTRSVPLELVASRSPSSEDEDTQKPGYGS